MEKMMFSIKQPKRWERQELISLIEHVRNHPETWQRSVEVSYEKMGQAWKNIADNLGKTPDECKRRFKALRDAYSVSRKNIKAGKSRTPYIFHEELRFLDKELDMRTGQFGRVASSSASTTPNNHHNNNNTNRNLQKILAQAMNNCSGISIASQLGSDLSLGDYGGGSSANSDAESSSTVNGTGVGDISEKLILHVQPREYLWNPDPYHVDHHKVIGTWAKIAEILGFESGPACELEWMNLVESYRNLREQFPTGSASENGITWPYFDMLRFLDDGRSSSGIPAAFEHNDTNGALYLPGIGMMDPDEAEGDQEDSETSMMDQQLQRGSASLDNNRPSKRQRKNSDLINDPSLAANLGMSAFFAEYFKHMAEASRNICPEALLVDDMFKRLDPIRKKTLRIKLYSLLAETEAGNEDG